MDIFNIDEEKIFQAINSAMMQAEADLTDQQINKIINTIDKSVPGLIELLVDDTTEYWRDMAGGVNGWGRKYAEGIKNKISDNEGSVFLDETASVKVGDKTFDAIVFARKVEQGVKSWSIRDALMQSEKAKTGKDGIKYITVPFPISTPRKASQGKQLSKFGGREMSSEIHNLVQSGGKAPKGTMLTTSSGRDINISGLSKWTTEQFHEQYGIFRRVSQNSAGWQYPNVQAVPVYSSVKEYVEKRINELIHEFCIAIIKENS